MKKQLTKVLSAIAAISMFTACGSADAGYDTENVNNGVNRSYSYDAADDVEEYKVVDMEGNGYANVQVLEEPEFYDLAEAENSEEYNHLEENGFISVANAPLSTFSSDVDTASYTNLRRMIYDGITDPDPDAVRIEEMINYFDYDYPEPEEGQPFSVYTEVSACPWNEDNRIFMAGISTKSLDSTLEGREPMNIVFLIDVSGSMYSEDKLPLVQKSFSMLTENLTAADRISIVTYAGEDAVLLEGGDGGDSRQILDVINSLEAGGSTAGAAGITTAYEIAEKYFIEGGNNRVILATDGDLNVGLSTEEELTELIEEKRESGVFLSVLGFGTGNLKDNRLEALADHGNGNYSYIDSEKEARKVLVDEMSGTLYTAAKDVKFQVEFNPVYVSSYHLIGYENRKMADEDFADDTKDAGDVGAGSSVTVLYEIVPAGGDAADVYSGLKYSETAAVQANEYAEESGELLTVNIRYKEPDGDESKLLQFPVDNDDYRETPSQRLNFASAVAQFGMLLRHSSYAGNMTYDDILTRLSAYDYSDDEYKAEFIYLVATIAG